MAKLIDKTANEAIGRITNNLAYHSTNSPAARAELRKWLDALEEPITYSNEDIDRSSCFNDFLIRLATDYGTAT